MSKDLLLKILNEIRALPFEAACRRIDRYNQEGVVRVRYTVSEREPGVFQTLTVEGEGITASESAEEAQDKSFKGEMG